MSAQALVKLVIKVGGNAKKAEYPVRTVKIVKSKIRTVQI